MEGEQEPLAAVLPRDIMQLILSMPCLEARDLASVARVCRAWREAADGEAPWAALAQRQLPLVDRATLAVLLERAQGRHRCPSKHSFQACLQPWTCDRCKEAFTDGTNSSSSCSYHPGILFSGGLMNGAGLRYTCCNRRAHHIPNGSRDSNGCTTSFHTGGQSAWQRHSTGVKPREQPPHPANASSTGGSSSSSSSRRDAEMPRTPGSSGSSPPRPYPFVNTTKELQEWHPNQRPGLLELPSRLFWSSGS